MITGSKKTIQLSELSSSICKHIFLQTQLRFFSLPCSFFLCQQILSLDGEEVGRISKNFNLVGDWLLNTHFFGISFPIDLDVRMKAVMLGACMLIVL